MNRQELEQIKPNTGRQILDINNACSEFIKIYSLKNKTKIHKDEPTNYNRYRILKFYNEPDYVFFKFSRDPYFMAKEGMSETVNVKHVKRLAQMHYKGLLYRMYFSLNNGYVYTIKFLDFLQKAYVEVENRSERKTKYIISFKYMERYQ